MAVQLIKSSDVPFGELYDKTGTKGDPGDRQTPAEMKPGTPPVLKSPDPATKPTPATQATDPKQFLKDNSAVIIQRLQAPGTGSTVTSNGVDFTITGAPVIDADTQ